MRLEVTDTTKTSDQHLHHVTVLEGQVGIGDDLHVGADQARDAVAAAPGAGPIDVDTVAGAQETGHAGIHVDPQRDGAHALFKPRRHAGGFLMVEIDCGGDDLVSRIVEDTRPLG